MSNQKNHQVTAIINIDLVGYDSIDGEISKNRLLNYLKSLIFILKTICDSPHKSDFFIKHKNKYFDKVGTLQQLEIMIEFFEKQNDKLEDEIHKEFFIENNNIPWPDLENGKINFEETFHYETWDSCKIIIGFNESEGDDNSVTLSRSFKDLIIQYGEGNSFNWSIEIGDNLNTVNSYNTVNDTEEED